MKELIGQALEEARTSLSTRKKLENKEYRIVSNNGRAYAITCDFHPDRLNLETDKEEFLSPEMQERVIYGTMLDCVRAMKDAEKYQSEIMSITNITKSISSEYQKSMVNESNILESNEVKQ